MNADQKGVLHTLSWLAVGIVIGIGAVILLQRAEPEPPPGRSEVAVTDKPGTGHEEVEPKASRPVSDEAPESVVIPRKWQFAGISSTRSGKSDSDWLSQYSSAELETIRKFNQLHPYAWTVHSAKEIAWMAQNGFPMPEDLFAADRMSDEELRDLAARAGGKAALLYYDRLSSERSAAIDVLRQQGGSAAGFIAAHPDVEAEWERMYQIVRQTESPFLGYLEASRALWLDDRRSVVEGFAGGLALAYFRGDDRAGNVLSANNTLTDDEAALAYRIVSQIRDYYPLPQDCGPGKSSPFPKRRPPP